MEVALEILLRLGDSNILTALSVALPVFWPFLSHLLLNLDLELQALSNFFGEIIEQLFLFLNIYI